MFTALRLLAVAALMSVATSAAGVTLHVDVNSTNPVAPYTNWATAANVIQDAVDAATNGDTVLVTNRVYDLGTRIVHGAVMNRVAVDKPLRLLSVNGPEFTTIVGYQVPGTTNGPGAIRCVYLTNRAVLSGFTLTNGATHWSGDSAQERSGGGLWCESTNAYASNCFIVGNSAWSNGGGAYSGHLDDCVLQENDAHNGGGAYESDLSGCRLTANTADYGGGSYRGELRNCVVTANSASQDGGGSRSSFLRNCVVSDNQAERGGGTYWSEADNCTMTANRADTGGGCFLGTLNNCILYFNEAFLDSDNHEAATLNHCCTTPLPYSGTGNLTVNPLLASRLHLSASSPCRGAGNPTNAIGSDIDGEPWALPPSIGCDEYWAGSITGQLNLAIATSFEVFSTGFTSRFSARIEGHATRSEWDFGDGTSVTNQPVVWHAWTTPGDFPVTLRAYNESWPSGVAATAMVTVVADSTHYVSAAGSNAEPPFLSWNTAATRIQDAVDVAVPGATVVVSNGVYGTGGRIVEGRMTNRVAVDKPLTLQSLNGPAVTVIEASGEEGMRCVYLADGARLQGFTLTNGVTLAGFLPYDREQSGGGVWCRSYDARVVECWIMGNRASQRGGGSYGGSLEDCVFTGNESDENGGGASSGRLRSCILSNNVAYRGGGASGGELTNCFLTGNSGTYGGGASGSLMFHCLVQANTASTGGGVYQGLLERCTLIGNVAGTAGGAYWGGLQSCVLSENVARLGSGNDPGRGGGVYRSRTENCTLTGNSAEVSGGGAYLATLTNCIVYFNTAESSGPNHAESSLLGCCTTPLPTNGVGNIDKDPLLASLSHQSADSPCRGAGVTGYSRGVDFDGELWASPPSIGCDEFWVGAVTGLVSVSIQAEYTKVAPGQPVDFQAMIAGRTTASCWDFGDGTVVSNQPYVGHSWPAPGEYPVVLTVYNETWPTGIAATVAIEVDDTVYHVSAASDTPVPPYASWATAATNIQQAVDVALPGSLVLVSNGVYAVGGRTVQEGLTNRVTLDKPLTLRSVNGPQFTVIEGRQALGTTNGAGAVRCVYMVDESRLSGFTLTNGATGWYLLGAKGGSGGGVWCESTNAWITNCVITGCAASWGGGGAYRGCLSECVFEKNKVLGIESTGGGAAAEAVLMDCQLVGNSAIHRGGGAVSCVLTRCFVSSNSVPLSYSNGRGGGAVEGTLENCLVVGNSAGNGGGAYESSLYSCTVAGNTARFGGGCYNGQVTNSIIYLNNALLHYGGDNHYSSAIGATCTTPPASSSAGNIWVDPQFVDTNGWADLRLQSNSPCINAGINAYVHSTRDLDGNARLAAGTVDMGAYEFPSPGSAISYVWLQAHGLPTDGSADDLDGDNDKASTWQEWKAWTDPTDPLSVLRMLAPTYVPEGVLLSWSSEVGGEYWLERGSTVFEFAVIETNLIGHPGHTTYRDHVTPAEGSTFYRVGTPTSPASPITLEEPRFVPAEVTVEWRSVVQQDYRLERSTAPQGPYSLLQSNIVGQAGTTRYTDTNIVGPGPFFYRVGVPE